MAKLSSLSLDRALPFRTRLKMRLHLLICVWCKRYLRQLRFMHNAAWQLQEEWMLVSNRRLSPQARERLKQALREFHEH
ncbi:MAG: zf-HC2 domain-containing protein [Verrucomicrobiota bacterium]